MSKQIRAGERERAKGKVREAFGKMTNNNSLRVKGKLEQVKGSLQKDLGKARKKI
ncbi:MAG TPA: CsbD family protein [Nitrososphaerales archaeon]|nr:CsbD family protein [Nitrososphaerales archaeon]